MGLLSWLLYLLFLVYVHYGTQFKSFGTMATMFFSGKFYCTFVLVVGTCFLFDTTTYSWHSLFRNTLVSAMMRLVKKNNPLDDTNDLPKTIKDCINQYALYSQGKEDAKQDKTPKAERYGEKVDSHPSIVAKDRNSYNEFELPKLIKKTSASPWVETLKVDELFDVQTRKTQI
jgi:hypothetical protein